jgi:alkylation response protein AidB-like acyl-CoA dehydrogenase
MDLLPSEQQEDVSQAVHALLSDLLPFRAVQALYRQGADDQRAWSRAVAEGWLGLGLPVESGGAGGGLPEELMLFRELGRHLTPGPYLGTMLGAHAASAAGAQALAADLIAGTMRLGLAWPLPGSTPRGPGADGTNPAGWICGSADDIDGVLLVSDEKSVVLSGSGITAVAIDSVDLLASRSRIAGEFIAVAHAVGPAISQRARILLAGSLCGVAEAALDWSAGHAKDRVQFGQPIGAFQAVKHRCADMAVRSESAWAMTSYAAAAFSAGLPDVEFYAEAAKLLAGRAAIVNSRDNIQNHGGMGFTDELGAHLYLRRAQALESTLRSSRTALRAIREMYDTRSHSEYRACSYRSAREMRVNGPSDIQR